MDHTATPHCYKIGLFVAIYVGFYVRDERVSNTLKIFIY